MLIVYARTENGAFASFDSTQNYTRLTGFSALEYMKARDQKQFAKWYGAYEDPQYYYDDIYFEVDPSETKGYYKDKRRAQYVEDSREESGIEEISLDAEVSGDDSYEDNCLYETIPCDGALVEDQGLDNVSSEALAKALDQLSKAEYDLVYALYLSPHRITQKEYAAKLGLTQPALIYRRKMIFEKLRSLGVSPPSDRP